MIRRIAYQGEPGAFSDLAIHEYFSTQGRVAGEVLDASRAPASDHAHQFASVPHDTFRDALNAVLLGDCNMAMLPVENAIAGPVQPALDAINEASSRLVAIDEHRLLIVLCVVGIPGADLATVAELWSHPVALAQCGLFTSRHPRIITRSHADTAGAAREVSELGELRIAAIASELAAERYGLSVIQHGVQDIAHNWTRFVLLRDRTANEQ